MPIYIHKLDLPPRIIEAAQKAKVENGTQVIYMSIPEIIRRLKISKEDASFLLKTVSKEFISRPVSTAQEILNGEGSKVFQNKTLTTGCGVLDTMLNGGISCFGITELVGESSCGKTQICLQLALTAQLPQNLNGIDQSVVYICTEDVFPTERLMAISRKFHNRYGGEIEHIKFGDNVYVRQVGDLENLWNCIEKTLPNLLASKNIGLIIIDSVAALFRTEYNISQNIERSKQIYQLGASLKRFISKYQVIVCCVNQISANIPSEKSNIVQHLTTSDIVPALGLTWSNVVSTRLFIKRTAKQIRIGTKHNATNKSSQPVFSAVREIMISFSPYLPNRQTEFIVNAYGVQGIKR